MTDHNLEMERNESVSETQEQGSTQSRRVAKAAVEALEDKLGADIRVLDIHKLSTLADYFIICHGNNPNHVSALIDSVEERLSEIGQKPSSIEGYRESAWVLLDFGGVIIHVFSSEARLFYDLERIWSDSISIDPETL